MTKIPVVIENFPVWLMMACSAHWRRNFRRGRRFHCQSGGERDWSKHSIGAAWLRRLAAAIAISLPVMGIGRAFALVGESRSDAQDRPHVLMILWSANGSAGFCTGVVITRDVALTAAHCAPPGAQLRFFWRNAEGRPAFAEIAAVARHPLYRADAPRVRRKSVDLALARAAAPFPKDFKPVELASGKRPLSRGESFKAVGFGETHEGIGASSGRLREATLIASGPMSHILLWLTDPARLNAGGCMGDSGGPVFRRDDSRLVAIIVWASGKGRARCGALTQAALIAPERKWLDAVLRRWGEE